MQQLHAAITFSGHVLAIQDTGFLQAVIVHPLLFEQQEYNYTFMSNVVFTKLF